MKLSTLSLVRLALSGSLALGCGSSHATSATAVSSPEGASSPSAPVDSHVGPPCLRTAEELAAALRSIAAHDVPPASPEDIVAPTVWTDLLREWNHLQSAALRVEEGSDAPGVGGRHRIWVHALRSSSALLERGPFEAAIDADGTGHFRAGTDDESLSIRIAREGECLRVDDR